MCVTCPLLQTSNEAGPSLLLESVEQFSASVGQLVASEEQGEVTLTTPNISKFFRLKLLGWLVHTVCALHSQT